jgi:hypothetical protein
MFTLPDGTVLYNDNVSAINHTARPKGCEDAVTRVPMMMINAAAGSSTATAPVFVYDEYTKTMWTAGAGGQLYNYMNGKELTLKDYRQYWKDYNNNNNTVVCQEEEVESTTAAVNVVKKIATTAGVHREYTNCHSTVTDP